MFHEPAKQEADDNTTRYKMRLGAWMFLAYLIVYSGFVAINVIKPVLMESVVLFGLNLAVVYGFGLIIVALILALIYNRMCGRKEKELPSGTDKVEGR
jgi:uncharacterized membrane protein (DUF485 family)